MRDVPHAHRGTGPSSTSVDAGVRHPTAALYAAGFVTFTIDDGARSLYLIPAAPVLLIGALFFVALPASLLAGGVRTPGLFRLGVVVLALAAAGAWLVQWATGRPSNLVVRDVLYGATAGAGRRHRRRAPAQSTPRRRALFVLATRTAVLAGARLARTAQEARFAPLPTRNPAAGTPVPKVEYHRL